MLLKINLYVYEDNITITTKKGGTLYIGDQPANNVGTGSYYNLFMVNEGSVAEEFNVSYNYSHIVQPISVHKGYNEIRVTVLYKGNIEEWLISSSLVSDENNVTTADAAPVKVSSIPVGGGEIDTSDFATKDELKDKQDTIDDLADIRTGAALGKTALQAVPAGYVKSALLEQEIANVERQITGVTATIPQKTSQLNNDSGFTTEAYVNTQVKTAIISALNTEV